MAFFHQRTFVCSYLKAILFSIILKLFSFFGLLGRRKHFRCRKIYWLCLMGNYRNEKKNCTFFYRIMINIIKKIRVECFWVNGRVENQEKFKLAHLNDIFKYNEWKGNTNNSLLKISNSSISTSACAEKSTSFFS